VEFMQKEITIMSEVYCETLKNYTGPAIQNKIFVYKNVSLVACFVNSSPEVTFRITLVN
jgi:hypothetical protein